MSTELQELPLDELHPSPYQARTALDEEVIDGARVALASGTFPAHMAITVRPRTAGGYEVLSGHHRVEAARLEGLSDVLAVVVKMTDLQAAIHIAAANNHAPMTPLDYGRHLLQLKEKFGTTDKAYADALGKTETFILNAKYAALCIESMGALGDQYKSLPLSVLLSAIRIRKLDDRKLLLDTALTSSRSSILAKEVMERYVGGDTLEAAIEHYNATPPGRGTYGMRSKVKAVEAERERERSDNRDRPDLAGMALLASWFNDCVDGCLRMLEVRAELEAKMKPDMSDPRQVEAFVSAVYRQLGARVLHSVRAPSKAA